MGQCSTGPLTRLTHQGFRCGLRGVHTRVDRGSRLECVSPYESNVEGATANFQRALSHTNSGGSSRQTAPASRECRAVRMSAPAEGRCACAPTRQRPCFTRRAAPPFHAHLDQAVPSRLKEHRRSCRLYVVRPPVVLQSVASQRSSCIRTARFARGPSGRHDAPAGPDTRAREREAPGEPPVPRE